jgi:SPP1 gp7 family putative phage head morphogenesis protein
MRYEAICCPKHDRPRLRRLQIKLRVAVKRFLKDAGKDIAAQVVRARDKLGKSVEDDIRRILDSLDFEDWERLIDQIVPLLEKMIAEGGAAAVAQLPMVGDVERLLSLVNEHGVEYAKRVAAELVTNISEATRNMIRSDVREAMENGESNDALASRLQRGYAFSPERAEMIARTETAKADVEGNIEAYKQSGVVSGKQWITGAGCCDLCDELDGTIVEIDEDFPNEGGSGPPLHPNCRCDVLPVLTED